jgi:hypothetical protein
MSRDSLPTASQWRSIQGGEPVILGNEASTVFDVVHVYETGDYKSTLPVFDTELSKKISQYGSVITTPVVQIARSVKAPAFLVVGPKVEPVKAPSVLLINAHGNPCSQRSGLGNESHYQKIQNPDEWRKYLEDRTESGWDLWSVVEQGSSLKLSLKGLLKNIV